MAPTAAQRRAIAELQSWLKSDTSEAREGPAAPGLLGRMADFQMTEVPLGDLRAADVPDPDVVAGPGATVTVRVRTARCKITIKDRTNWPIAGVAVEVWSQALGSTNDKGIWESQAFFSGSYALKMRAKFVGYPSGGPHDPVLPFEVAKDVDFPEQLLELPLQVALSASGLSINERVSQILWRTVPLLPGEMANQLRGLISPVSIAIFATLAALWAAGHLVAVGEIADGIALAALIIKFGLSFTMAVTVAEDLISVVQAIATGKTEFDLDEGAHAMARVIATMGFILLMKVGERAVAEATKNPGKYRPKGAAPENVVEPPLTKAPAEALSSPLGKKLSSTMGKSTYEERLVGVEECIKKDPKLRDIPREDLASLRGYTSDAATDLGRSYKPGAVNTPKDYSVLNGVLRAKDAKAFPAIAEYLDSALRAFNRFPKVRVKTWRGIRLEETPPGFAGKLKIGKVFKDEGFFSSSTKQSKAAQFVQGSKAKVIFVIQGYSGRNVSSLSELPNEAEILFRPGTRFFIAGKRVVGDVTEISVFEIRQDAAEFVAIWGKGQALVANLKRLIAEAQQPATP